MASGIGGTGSRAEHKRTARLVSAVDYAATVDMQHLARHVTTIIAGQIDIGRPQLTGLSRSLQGRVGAKCFHSLLVERRGYQGGPYRARGHTVDANAALSQLNGGRSGKADNGAF